MLYDAVAELFGVDNDHNLQTAVDNSGVSVLDYLIQGETFSKEDHQKLVDALNKQTDVMIEAELANPSSQQKLEDMLFALSQLPGVRITGLPNRKTRRKNKSKKKA